MPSAADLESTPSEASSEDRSDASSTYTDNQSAPSGNFGLWQKKKETFTVFEESVEVKQSQPEQFGLWSLASVLEVRRKQELLRQIRGL